jgi:hypothetical protein
VCYLIFGLLSRDIGRVLTSIDASIRSLSG